MAKAAPTDVDLVSRARRGDVAAFGRLVERHQDFVYNAVFHLVGNEQDAEDLAQDVFIRAFGSLARFEGRAKFTTWVYGIMLNTVRSHWRRAGRRAVVSLDVSADDDHPNPGPPATGDGPVDASLRREEVRHVRAAIAGLDSDLREITVLRDIEGLAYEELAQVLGVPIGTVKSRLHRARRQLKDRLEPFYGGAL